MSKALMEWEREDWVWVGILGIDSQLSDFGRICRLKFCVAIDVTQIQLTFPEIAISEAQKDRFTGSNSRSRKRKYVNVLFKTRSLCV